MSPHSLTAPSKKSSATMAVSLIMPPPAHSSPPMVCFYRCLVHTLFRRMVKPSASFEPLILCCTPTTSITPHTALSTPITPHKSSVSMTPVVPPTAPASQLYPQQYSCRPQATREPPAPPLHQYSLPVMVVRVAPPVNPHPMITQAKRGFRSIDSPYRPLQHRPCCRCPPLSMPPSSIRIGAVP
jgi:hypothetical protein